MPASRSPQIASAGSPLNRSESAVHGDGAFPIVGIGASSGGLDACERLLRALPAESGMAFILVQHLDPTHESLMVELLASHTTMPVEQATDGTTIEKDHLYVIPPATYLSVAGGQLRLSRPRSGQGARLSFDHLLASLAEECGPFAVCVVLSGTGADGSLGLRTVKKNLGLVIVQTPEEAAYDGMPRSAILTGAVDLVLDVADIPPALINYQRSMKALQAQGGARADDEARLYVPEIIDLLRLKTPLDFRPCKHGTLQRRIERRMAMAKIDVDGMGRYLDVLRDDSGEVEQLAKDLLINVTSFFRDPGVFDVLAKEVIPELVRGHSRKEPLRLWIAGCSTGEETYSLAMLFHEEIAAQNSSIKLQLFASDADADAITTAREGFYPFSIEAEVSAERLARFFTREEHGYRIQSELRAMVVFAVQDLLTDPPFSRLDFISCRNLLIYLLPEAQAKAIALFHFALCEGGILLLGSAETVGTSDRHFKTISRPEKIYRRIGRSRPGDLGFALTAPGLTRLPARPEAFPVPAPQVSYAGLCRRLMLEAFAPVAVLINRNLDCLHSSGPTDRYLRVPPGVPTHDLLAIVRPELRAKLRTALLLSWHQKRRMTVHLGQVTDPNGIYFIHADLLPVVNEDEELMLVCFQDRPGLETDGDPSAPFTENARIEELERMLAAARLELHTALRQIEMSSEEQKAVTEETLSANEEYQSANEELLTSKEELQSLNEELTALNAQLQETLDKQRTAANDLQNVLYSTDVATLFLDTELKIRFFTPATKSLFNVIPGDIGRPLADLHSVAADTKLIEDAQTVLRTHGAIEREIEAIDGSCYVRRILPYRTQINGVEGVVITFIDITDRRYIAHALEAAKQQAEAANTAKSRFLAAASHDLRQPMQTLSLIQGFLAKEVLADRAAKRVAQLGDALSAMAGMLNTLLDINEIEAGTIHAQPVEFAIGVLLTRLRDEFTYPAAAKGLELIAVPSRLQVTSDPRLLEQILRNLIANALKYTKKGRVLFGCRHRPGVVSIEIWDTGIGIADEELLAIFDEYHQIDNAARERSRGLGLGLSIVRRLARLLGHHIKVRSWPGKGSVFFVDIKIPAREVAAKAESDRESAAVAPAGERRLGAVLLVEDDPDLRELLELTLSEEGHFVRSAQDSVTAMALLADGTLRPDLLLSDFNLPNGLNGLQLAALVRTKLGFDIPVIILTGDISNLTLHDIAVQNCLALSKPAKLDALADAIQSLLLDKPVARPSLPQSNPSGRPAVVFVVDDDSQLRAEIRALLEEEGHVVEDFDSCEAFLAAFRPGMTGCLLIDAYLPGMKGLELLKHLKETDRHLPTIMITGRSDVPTAVQAMKSGASDFLDKPFERSELLASIDRAHEQSRDESTQGAWQTDAVHRIAGLTPRQRQIMDMVLAGLPNKNIAADLSISQRTVEHHRAAIMEKTGSKSLPALARLALFAAQAKGG
jgi:two-component system CheB/CheR fusion protein